MASRDRPYRRLPGTGRRLFSSFRLWLGPDHLLHANLQGYAEEYQRFYLRDIQAIVVRRTNRRAHLGTLFTLLALLTLMFAAGSRGPVGRGIWGTLGGLCLLALAVNLLRGPTCTCHLRTPLQTVLLPSLHRVRLARRALAILRPRLEQVQGTIAPEEILAHAGDPVATIQPPELPPPIIVAGGVESGPVVGAVGQAVGGAGRRHENARAHAVLAGLLLVDAAITPLQIRHPTAMGLTLLGLLLFTAQLGFAIAALVRQRDSDVAPALARFVWSSLIALTVFYFLAVGQVMVRSFVAAFSGKTPPNALAFTGRFMGMPLFAMTVEAVLGVWGLVAVRRHREATRPGR
jgi:hypothetical protein